MRVQTIVAGTILAVAVPLLLPAAEIPSVSAVTLSQPFGSRAVQITYTLHNGPAVVTLDIQTNAQDGAWVSIGADVLYAPGNSPKGDVNKIVEGSSGSITWRPVETWMAAARVVPNARAVLTAWPLDDKPPYMVVDVSQGGADSADRIRYYQSEDFLPGGLLTNTDYRKNKLVLKKVIAKGVTFTMGAFQEFGRQDDREMSHRVTLDHNYYLGVFPITQAQCTNIWGRTYDGNFPTDGEMRLRDKIRFDTWAPFARGKGVDPSSDSLLGLLRARTAHAIDFDLPGEAEWEFACRAGTGEGYWNNGRPLTANSMDTTATDDNLPGRYLNNQQIVGNTAKDVDAASGTPIAGSYAPNAWGFYDMHGGVAEWCRDWYQADITGLDGKVNVSADGTTCLDGTTTKYRVVRGGFWAAGAANCRSASRSGLEGLWPGDNDETGMRVACRAGLK